MLTFCKDLAVGTNGVVTGDIGEFWRRGWLRADELCLRPRDRAKRHLEPVRYELDSREIGVEYVEDAGGSTVTSPIFHPFRIYPAKELIDRLSLNWSITSILQPSYTKHYEGSVGEVQRAVQAGGMTAVADTANGVADLAILLEPIFWPWVTSRYVQRSLTLQADREKLRSDYQGRVEDLVKALDVEELRRVHEQLRHKALMIDPNEELYLLLRAASWETRRRAKGAIALAMWIRHMAELVRRAAERVHGVTLPEEDEGFGVWYEGGRKRAYGSTRPLDYPSYYRRDLLQHLGLDASIRVKWYVEGATERGFIQEALGDPRESQVEVADRKGKFSGKAVVDLFAELKQDIEAERFSLLSLDNDVPDNVASVRRMAEQDLIVGYVALHDPDFEFANFALEELIEAAIKFDASDPVTPTDSATLLRGYDWSGVTSGRSFEERYLAAHESTRQALKGERWGQILYQLGVGPQKQDGSERPAWTALQMAQRAPVVDYEAQRTGFCIDPTSLQNEERHTT